MNLLQKPILYLTLLASLSGGIVNDTLAVNPSKEAYNTFMDILKIPKCQSIYDQRQVAKVYIFNLADKLGNQNKNATTKEIKKALDELNEVSGKVADQYFGNKNGKTEPWEFEKMGSSMNEFPGLEEITQMYIDYHQ